MRIEFDPKKERENLSKHGVDFSTAENVFADPLSLSFVDSKHSRNEDRFIIIGNDGRGILTVRFTMRGKSIRIIGAGYWRKGKKIYEKENR